MYKPSKNKDEFIVSGGLANKLEYSYSRSGDKFVIADLGSGSGLYHEDIKSKLEGLGDKEIEIVALDINRERLENNESECIQSDLAQYRIPLKENSLDFIYSNHLSCQISEEEMKQIQEDAERVLKESGNQHHRC